MIVTDEIKQKVAGLARKHDLSLVALFGSQATGRTHARSDLDLAVLSGKEVNRARLALEFDAIFGRGDTEVVDLRSASPTLSREVVSDGKLLYESEEEVFFRWKLYAIKIWMETKWLRDLADKKALEWAKTL